MCDGYFLGLELSETHFHLVFLFNLSAFEETFLWFLFLRLEELLQVFWDAMFFSLVLTLTMITKNY